MPRAGDRGIPDTGWLWARLMSRGMNTTAFHTRAPSWAQRRQERNGPKGPVVMYQRWEHLLFLHWRWDPEAVQRTLPAGLTVDVADGAAWLGLVPLFMRSVRPRFVPAVPWASDFLELNLRTYVFDAQGRPGLYFYSLDCDQPLAVEGARRLLHLRYEHADLSADVGPDGTVAFASRRRREGAERDSFRYQVAEIGGGPAAEGSLEYFLVERYRLFADGGGERLSTIQVSHVPYRLHPVELSTWGVAALRQSGFDPGARPPDHVCGADPVDVEVSLPVQVERE